MRIKLFLILIKRWIEGVIIIKNRKKKKVRFLYHVMLFHVILIQFDLIVFTVLLLFGFIMMFCVTLDEII
jgi:hypothetical protein